MSPVNRTVYQSRGRKKPVHSRRVSGCSPQNVDLGCSRLLCLLLAASSSCLLTVKIVLFVVTTMRTLFLICVLFILQSLIPLKEEWDMKSDEKKTSESYRLVCEENKEIMEVSDFILKFILNKLQVIF
jgi:hypothetical protein